MSEGSRQAEVLSVLKESLFETLRGERLTDAVSKWLLLYGADDDEFALHALKVMDEDDWRDSKAFREQRAKGKEARYCPSFREIALPTLICNLF